MHLAPDGPVLVVGPGAVGTLLAARIAHAGHEVVVAARDGAAARALDAGVTATDPFGEAVRAQPRVVASPRGLPGPARMLVLATKCADAEAALAAWLPAVGEEAPAVAVQNGVLGDRLKPLAGDRLVECTVALPATLRGPGDSVQTGPGGLHIGPWPRPGPRDDPAQFKAVARVLAAAAPVRASPNMRGVKWTKLAVNSCITTLGALTGAELGELLDDARARRAFLAIAREAHAAGRADGVRFEPVGGFRPGLMASRLPGRDLLLRALGRRHRRHRSSSLQGLERGRRTEVDFLNGHVVATARRHGLDAPVNAALVDLVRRIEAGRMAPSPAALADLPLEDGA